MSSFPTKSNLNETKFMVFLIKNGSTPFSFTRISKKPPLTRLLLYLALLSPKTGNLCKISQNFPVSQSVDISTFVKTMLSCFRFFCSLRRCQQSDCNVDLVLLRYVHVSFFAVSFWWKFIFTWVLLCVGKFSRASLKVDTMSQWLGLPRKIVSDIKMDDKETKIGMCFSVHIVVLVYLKSSSSSEIDSKSKMAMLLRSLWLSV